MEYQLALDSERTYDKDGRLHIGKSHISKACVSAYLGSEIPMWDVLGLDPNKIYKLLRDPDELKKGAHTFARLPILSKHVPINTKEFPSDLVVGAVGSEVDFDHPYLNADTCFWTQEAIGGIESDTIKEFSCAYHYIPVMIPGIYEGEKYDGVMTEIEGNHLAQVEAGRAGPDVMAADSKLEIPKMKMTKLGKALFVAIGAASPKLALDAAFPAVVGNVTKKTFDKAAVRKALLGLDADLPVDKVDTVMDALSDMEDEPDAKEPKKKPAEDEAHPADCDCKDCKKVADDKTAKDAEEKMKGAMDSFKLEIRQANDAKTAVRSVLGETIASDSATEIYTLALDHLKVPHTGVTELAGLKALYELAGNKPDAPAPIAQDHAGVIERFPDLARFR